MKSWKDIESARKSFLSEYQALSEQMAVQSLKNGNKISLKARIVKMFSFLFKK